MGRIIALQTRPYCDSQYPERSREPRQQNREPQIIPWPWNLMETAWLDFEIVWLVITFFLPVATFLNGNGCSCPPVPPLLLHFWEQTSCFLISQVYKWKGILPQDGLYSEPHLYIIYMKLGNFEISMKCCSMLRIWGLRGGWVNFACDQTWIFGGRRMDFSKNAPPIDVHTLIARICECYKDKGILQTWLRLRILIRTDYPALSGCTQFNHRSP